MARLCRPAFRPMPAFLTVLAIALMSGGCSLSYQLDSLSGKNEDQNEYTGSIKPAGDRATDAAPASVEAPLESDLIYARAAASEVLSRGGKDTSAPWANPQTGARGTVTPLASAYDQDGLRCRDFLASYVRDGSEAWLQGEACNMQGQWQVRSMRPWKRS
jgi:outer membrane surface antigen